MTKPTIGEMRVVKRPTSAWLTELEIFDGKEWQPVPSPATSPTDAQLFEEANQCGLLACIRLAAACNPEQVKLEEICSPANTALIAFARNVLARYGQ